MRLWLRRLRGMMGNSVLWGLAWFCGSTAILGALLMLGILPRSAWSWELIFEWTRRIGIAGFGAGAVFSASLPLLFRDKVFSDVDATRFVLGAATLAGVTSLGVIQVTIGAAATIHPSPLLFAGVAALFGGGTAAASLAAARHAQQLQEGDGRGALLSSEHEAGKISEGEAFKRRLDAAWGRAPSG